MCFNKYYDLRIDLSFVPIPNGLYLKILNKFSEFDPAETSKLVSASMFIRGAPKSYGKTTKYVKKRESMKMQIFTKLDISS